VKNLAMMALSFSVLIGFANYGPTETPRPISVRTPTEHSIQEEMKNEQREKEYARATIVAQRVYHRNGCQGTFSQATGQVAVETGISPRVLAALVYVESSCNPNAVSGKRSVGLTQINPLVWNYSRDELRDPERNLRIGATILSAYVRRFGLVGGLHHYNGLGNISNSYADKVLTAAGLKG
jgi:hypothetical protein